MRTLCQANKYNKAAALFFAPHVHKDPATLVHGSGESDDVQLSLATDLFQ